MKKIALLAAAAALLTATPAMAQAGGHVGLNLGNTDGDTDDVWQAEAAFGAASGSIGYQVDGGFGSTDGDVDHYTLAGHLYYNGDGWRLGGIVAQTSIDPDGSDSTNETAYGIEGTLNLGPSTVIGGSYTVGETEFLVDLDSWNADVGLNWYLSDNFRVGGAYGVGNLDAGGGDLDTTTIGVNAEWQPFTLPVSFRASYETFDLDVFGDFETFTFGVRWNWGGTLRERDNATPFETKTPLYQRAYAIQ